MTHPSEAARDVERDDSLLYRVHTVHPATRTTNGETIESQVLTEHGPIKQDSPKIIRALAQSSTVSITHARYLLADILRFHSLSCVRGISKYVPCKLYILLI